MNTNSQNSDWSVCSHVRGLMERQLTDESLSDAEQQQLDVHMGQCDSCRDRLKLLSGLSVFVDDIAEAQLDDRVASMMDQLRRERLHRHGNRTSLWMAAAAALLMGVAVWLWTVYSGTDDIGTFREPWACEVSAPVELVDGVFMTFCRDLEPGSLIEDGDVLITLHRGIAGLHVDPERPGRKNVSVKTPLGEVRVRGTLFTVHVDDADTRVEVFRGIVELFPADMRVDSVRVSRGQEATFTTLAPTEWSAPRTAFMLTSLPDEPLVLPRADVSTEVLRQPDASDDELKSEVPAKRLSEDTSPVVRRSPRSRSDVSTASMDSLIQEAQTCLLERDWHCAAERYRKVLEAYAHRKESTAVRISLARVELNHLNAPTRALAHFNAYLQLAPEGPLCEEALLGKAEAHRRLGQLKSEEETLRTFLRRFPVSSQANRASQRLTQLIGTPTATEKAQDGR